jgi:hypothetical protein
LCALVLKAKTAKPDLAKADFPKVGAIVENGPVPPPIWVLRVITRLNGRLRKPIVQKIRCYVTPPRGIKVGALKPNWEDPTFPEVVPAPRNVKPDPNDECAKRAHALTANIEDDAVRATMERLIATAMRARENESDKGIR